MSPPTANDKRDPTLATLVALKATVSKQIDDCWNRIGVEGDGGCSELGKFIHCRNCPRYAAAATQLLRRSLPADYRQEWADHFAQSAKMVPAVRTSALVFRIGEEWLALPTPAFQEVAEKRPIHSLPHRRTGIVLGLVNVRGELIICISFGRLFGLESGGTSDTLPKIPDWLLVANWDGHRLAFPVDEIGGIHRFPAAELKEPPATVAKSALTFTQGVFLWRDRTVGHLDADTLFATLNRSLA